MNINCVGISKPKICEFPENTIGMSRIATICTIIEPMLLFSFFFTDVAVIFTRVVFNSITKSKGVFMMFVPSGIWQCSTFEVESKFTNGTTKYLVTFRITTSAILLICCGGEDKLVLMTSVDKDV